MELSFMTEPAMNPALMTCPLSAIVLAFGIDERSVQNWQLKAGHHAWQVQAERVYQRTVELGQVQADERCRWTSWPQRHGKSDCGLGKLNGGVRP